MNWDDLETFTRKPRRKKRKKKYIDVDVEEINFDGPELYVMDVHPEIIQEMENRLRKIKREEEN